MSTPYDAADIYAPEMAAWRPYLGSPDWETNMFRDRMVARTRDIERNDGWARGGITRVLDNIIGAQFRPISKPDYRALAYYSGSPAFDVKWADEFGHAIDSCWRTWAEDPSHYCDGMQCLPVSQLFWVAMRHKLIDGDALAVMLWRPELIGVGKARYATSLQLIDPDRLSNPQLRYDQNAMRGGVEVDDYGNPVGYWIRRAHQGDWFSAAKSMHWDFFPRRTAWGRPIVVHDYDHDRASQHRGGAGILVPILQRLKMLVQYDRVELNAAVINAIFSAYVKSPYDQQMVDDAMTAGANEGLNSLGMYQDMRSDWWRERKSVASDVQMTHLFPGEEIGTVSASRPSRDFEPFEVAILRHVASGLGCTYEQLSGDFSRTNYSSFRGATNEVLKTFNRRSKGFEAGFANPVRAAFIEEVMNVEDIPLPEGAPSFEEFRGAYSRCSWLRPGRGWTNPVDERRGSILGMQAGLSTLEIEAAENSGYDWEELVDQRAVEVQRFRDRGLSLPEIYQPAPTQSNTGLVSTDGTGASS